MTIETLKDLIKREFERSKAIGVVEENVMYLLDLYAKDQLPDYRRPYIDPTGYYPMEIPCGIPDKVPYGSICPCNPAKGGSGICGCTLGNTMVDNPAKYGQPKTNFDTTTGAYIAKDYPPGTTITNTPGVTGNITVTN